ncbi:MAG: purine nucleoside phosphorylase [Planctomycetota bacterium]|nr:MAG: purine nucleoside phosphorylase [Planctomycetota bacterium]
MVAHFEQLTRGADHAAQRLGRAGVGVVLGSGLSEALDNLDHPQFMPYGEIAGMPQPSVEGHRGALVRGTCNGVPVFGLCGRVHLYEGRPHEEAIAGVRLLSLLGVHTLIITSAVGSTDENMGPGSLMLVSDHINLSGQNVLRGPHEPRFGPRFPDLSDGYDAGVMASLDETAGLLKIQLERGVLAQFLGPTYESPAEVRMARELGARVVSMSMVPEMVAARQRGMRVGGIACVTNLAAGVQAGPIKHEDVLIHSASIAANVGALICGAAPRLASRSDKGAKRKA